MKRNHDVLAAACGVAALHGYSAYVGGFIGSRWVLVSTVFMAVGFVIYLISFLVSRKKQDEN